MVLGVASGFVTNSCEGNALLALVEYGFSAIVFAVDWLVLWRFVPLCGRGWRTGQPFPGRQSLAGFLGSPALFRQHFGREAGSRATAS